MKGNKRVINLEVDDLINFCDSITDCHHSSPVYIEEGEIVIRNFNIKEGRLKLDKIYYTDYETYKQRRQRSIPEAGDLIITREAPMGEVCIIPEGLKCCLGQRMVLIKPDYSKIDNKFLLYSLLSQYCQTQIYKSEGTGSIVSNLRIPLLKGLKIPIVELSSQKIIGATLGSIDAKIELNNKINSELEAMAKTLYDYWFVQFDFPFDFAQDKPVTSSVSHRAESRCEKPYKTSGGKMVWNEELKREIPEGWEVKRLDKIMRIVRGASPRPIEKFMSPSGIPWIKISDATKSNNRFILFTKEFIKKEGVSKSRELFPGTLILSNSASPGIPKIVTINACVHDGWLIVDSFKESFYNEFMYHYFENFRSKILNMGTGSIFKNLKTEYIKELLVAVPPKDLMVKSEKVFKNLSDKILLNAKENQQLASLRDWLLPMLMNGQVSVGDVEGELRMVAEPNMEYKKG